MCNLLLYVSSYGHYLYWQSIFILNRNLVRLLLRESDYIKDTVLPGANSNIASVPRLITSRAREHGASHCQQHAATCCRKFRFSMLLIKFASIFLSACILFFIKRSKKCVSKCISTCLLLPFDPQKTTIVACFFTLKRRLTEFSMYCSYYRRRV
jgi:hypothetical protein